MNPGCRAAVEVGRLFDVGSDDPVVIRETHNTAVWLRPHPVIAKVGSSAGGAEQLVREHEVASALNTHGAPVGRPLAASTPQWHPGTGLMVTLWERLERDLSARTTGPAIGVSLRQVHESLEDLDLPGLPDFHLWLTQARDELSDRTRLAALGAEDIEFLGAAFDALFPRLEDRGYRRQPLHGEPHAGNYLVTRSGIRWIDFEGVCRGPLEWDLVFLPEDARRVFSVVDQELVSLLSILNSARVATWCWAQAGLPEMRRHGRHHLNLVRASWPYEGRPGKGGS